MIGKLIDFILRDRLVVIVLAVLLLVGGLYAFSRLDIEAYPDPSPPTIEVIAQNLGWSAEEMERQITVPLETQLNGMPGLDHIRSISLFGLTDIKCYFEFETDYNFDRQEVLNRLPMTELPAGVDASWSGHASIETYLVSS
jgi:heavy metal efflux system protein